MDKNKENIFIIVSQIMSTLSYYLTGKRFEI